MEIEDVWKYISNKVANKVNDPFEDLHATVVPIIDGEFGEPISSISQEDWEGDTYLMLRDLATEEVARVGSTFAYFCPGKKRHPDTNEVISLTIIFALIKNPSTVEFGVWDIADNKVEFMREEEDGESWGGELPLALCALSLRAAIDNDELGELGQMMKEALKLAKESFLKFQEVMEHTRGDD